MGIFSDVSVFVAYFLGTIWNRLGVPKTVEKYVKPKTYMT